MKSAGLFHIANCWIFAAAFFLSVPLSFAEAPSIEEEKPALSGESFTVPPSQVEGELKQQEERDALWEGEAERASGNTPVESESMQFVAPSEGEAAQPPQPAQPAVAKEFRVRHLYDLDGSSTGWGFTDVTRLFYDRRSDELYILDRNSGRILVVDAKDGVFLHSISFTDAGIRGIPLGFAVGAEGDIYVAESERVAVLNYRGTYKGEFDLSHLPARRPIQGIAVDDEGRIYLAMAGAVSVFDKNRAFLFEVKAGPAAPFINASKVSVSADSIYILDPAQFGVFRFSRDGAFISSFGYVSGLAGGFSMPIDLAAERKTAMVAVLDANRYAVIFFGAGGEFVFEFGTDRTIPRPAALAMGPNGRFFVVTAQSRLIRAFQLYEVEVPVSP